jgi:WD40 repeat protein
LVGDYNRLGLSIDGMAYHPSGSLLATMDFHGTLRLWNAKTEMKLLENREFDRFFSSNLVFSPDGKLLAAGGYLEKEGKRIAMKTWSMPDGKLISTYEPADYIFPRPVIFSPDSKYLIVIDNKLDIVDPMTGKSIGKDDIELGGEAISPDGKWLFKGELGAKVKFTKLPPIKTLLKSE